MSTYAQLLPASARLLLVLRDLKALETPTRDDLMGEAGITTLSHYYTAMRQLRELGLVAAPPRWSALSTALGQRGVAEAQRGDWRESQRDDRQDQSGDFLETHISYLDDRGARKTTGFGPTGTQIGPTGTHPQRPSVPPGTISGPTGTKSGPLGTKSGPTGTIDDDDSSVFEVLEGRCQDADEMDATGEWSIRNSPRNLRRKAQIAVLKELWLHLFPEANPIIDTNVKAFLGKCDDSAYEVAQVWVSVQRYKPQNPLTYGLIVAGKRETKQTPSNDPFDEKHEMTAEELADLREAKRVAAQLWGEDEDW